MNDSIIRRHPNCDTFSVIDTDMITAAITVLIGHGPVVSFTDQVRRWYILSRRYAVIRLYCFDDRNELCYHPDYKFVSDILNQWKVEGSLKP